MKHDVFLVRTEGRDPAKRLAALERLLEAADPFAGYKKGAIVPVKVTIGDSPCVYHVAPQYAKLVVAKMKKRGAKPFLFDTSVIYKGRRQNAVDHLTLAQDKGFGHTAVGAPFIIADGVFGQDGRQHTVGSPAIHTVRIPSFIGMLENLFVISHVTGHIVAGYAGALKNVAMGMSCRATKQVQHSSLKPSVKEAKCVACGSCIALCPVKAISFVHEKARIDPETCIGCGECLCACTFDAITINWDEDPQVFCRRMVDVAAYILSRFKGTFFVNVALDVTKECDCISTKDEKMVSADIGILASTDPVALDKATADLVTGEKRAGFFGNVKGLYDSMFAYAAERGIGTLDYRLVEP